MALEIDRSRLTTLLDAAVSAGFWTPERRAEAQTLLAGHPSDATPATGLTPGDAASATVTLEPLLTSGLLNEPDLTRLLQTVSAAPTVRMAPGPQDTPTKRRSGGIPFPSRRPEAPSSPTRPSAASSPSTLGTLPGKTIGRFGKYDLVAEIGRGGMGVIYRAYDTEIGRTVALKMLLAGEGADSEEIGRFRREAQAAAILHHPNIIPIYEVSELDRRQYYTMELVEGRSLAGRIKAEGRMESREAVSLLSKVAAAVHYAHTQGIVHRDLKPANILLDAQNGPHVGDFGLAKIIERGGPRLTISGTILGTPSYMAPEQARGTQAIVDARADVYALGAVLYEMLTGVPPFDGETPLEIVQSVLSVDALPPRRRNPAIPRDLETICLKALEKSAEKRFASAQALQGDLDRWLAGMPILARPVSMAERAVRLMGRHKPVTLAVCAIVVGLGIAGIFGWDALRTRRDQNLAIDLRLKEQAGRRDQAARILEDVRDKLHLAESNLGRMPRAEREQLVASALSRLAEAEKLDPGSAEAAYLEGRAHFLAERMPQALTCFDRAILRNPDFAPAYIDRSSVRLLEATGAGLTTVRMGKWVPPDPAIQETCRRDLDRFKALGGEEAKLRLGRGMLSMMAGDFKGSLPDLDEAIRLNPYDFFGYFSRGWVHFGNAMGLGPAALGGAAVPGLDKARADFEEAARIDPFSPLPHLGMATTELVRGRHPQALAAVEKGLSIDPENPSLHYMHGTFLYQSGRPAEAVEDFRIAFKAGHGDPELQYMLGLSLFAAGSIDEALGELEAYLRVAPPGDQKRSATELIEQGRTMKTWLTREAASAAEHLERAEAFMNFGRLEGARDDYREFLRRVEDPGAPEVSAMPAGKRTQGIWTAHYNLACLIARLGISQPPDSDARQRAVDEALEEVWKAFKAGYHDADHAAGDKDLLLLRGELRFKRILEEMRAVGTGGAPPKHGD